MRQRIKLAAWLLLVAALSASAAHSVATIAALL